MARLILDTSVLVAVERDDRALEAAVADHDDVAIAAVTVAELEVGVQLAKGRRRQARRRFVDEVVETLEVVAYDHAAARHHADLLVAARKTGRPRGAHDLLIAACARASGRSIVTADQDGFEGLPGVKILPV